MSAKAAIHPAPTAPTDVTNGIELAVILPTFNESENIRPVLTALSAALAGIEYEVIFVDDDSRDGTHALVREIARSDRRVRIIQRVGRRGLSSACVEGMLSTAAPYIAVMDADLQHDEQVLPEMFRKLKSGGLDIVIGSRNVEGGSMGEFTSKRVALSDLGRNLSRIVCHCDITDPMSGFFILDRRFLEETVHNLSAVGFKILVDLLASARRPVRLGEVPYRFRSRRLGESKLDTLVALEYLQLLIDKSIGDYIPPRLLLFGLVGAAGLAVYLTALYSLHVVGVPFTFAQTTATVIAMTFNFFVNNSITYRDRKLKGWKILGGVLSFYAACSIGLLLNIKLSSMLQIAGMRWYTAGIVGLAVSWMWNFGATHVLTWRSSRRHARDRASRLVTKASAPLGDRSPQ